VAKQRGRQQTTSRKRDGRKGSAGGGRFKPCPFCRDKVDVVDYKDFGTLRRAMSEKGKIRSARITGACRRHQRQLAQAVKRARELGLLPYVSDR
jgi:small subunit ribosomal protein S18